MASQPPRVSVLMTTYNGARTIGDSIASVLAQSFRDFELVVVDDCSSDNTPAILAGISDPRVRVLRPDRNLGVVGARNFGFTACRGDYLAAHDHDDLSRPERFAQQVALLDSTPGVVLAATEVTLESDGRLSRSGHAADGSALAMRWLLLVDNPLTWSSVMMRTDAVRRSGAFVRPDYELSDDFDLYHRLLSTGDIVRLPAQLTVYRWHATNTARAGRETLLANAVKVLRAAYAEWLGNDAEDAAQLVVRHLSHRTPVPDSTILNQLGSYLERLLNGFCTAHGLAAPERTQVAALAGKVWWGAVRASVRTGNPNLARTFRDWPGLVAAFQPRVTDRAVSVAIGGARRLLPDRTRQG
ncbi:MAG TPA: glycosyltransferase family 2 protein [Acetobacteraceae bacterium]|nr:glycosyltransferase family 2 protein [Acetobacteraceae bacterium]